MPHQCVRCGKFYDDGSDRILKGCDCGAKLFFFVKKEAIKKAEEATAVLSEEEKIELEKEVYDLIDFVPEEDSDPVVLDFESIRVLKPGKFEIDLIKLFDKGKPTIYKLGDGKYIIDIAETFEKTRKNKD